MTLTLLKSKIHRATVTDADLSYEGSISIDPKLCDIAQLNKFENLWTITDDKFFHGSNKA